MEQLPLRVDDQLARILGQQTAQLEICDPTPEGLPSVKVLFPRPAAAKAVMLLRVHSRTGIPLASASVAVNPGDRLLESSPMAVIAMEGYTHLDRSERQLVERRVWSRRAFVTASMT
jgi:hypothetical protein